MIWLHPHPLHASSPFPLVSSTGRHTGRLRKRNILLTEEGGGRRSQIIRLRESLVRYKSFNTLWGSGYPPSVPSLPLFLLTPWHHRSVVPSVPTRCYKKWNTVGGKHFYCTSQHCHKRNLGEKKLLPMVQHYSVWIVCKSLTASWVIDLNHVSDTH